MGRSTTPPYRLELEIPGFYTTPSCWRVKAQYQIPGYGKPTAANLQKHVEGFEASCAPGGCNQHLGTRKVRAARIVNQFTAEVVATYAAA
jgi:hypothetical protein